VLAMPGPETLLLVAIVAIVIFGGAKIPELARSLGKAKGEFQKGLAENDQHKAQEAAPAPSPAAAAPPVAPAAPTASPEPVQAEGSEP
jgi:sec-independent protein translocase protein TatA